MRPLPITVDPDAAAQAWESALSLARQHGLSGYDAASVEVAIRRGLPLAIRDARLRAAAVQAGVALVPPPGD